MRHTFVLALAAVIALLTAASAQAAAPSPAPPVAQQPASAQQLAIEHAREQIAAGDLPSAITGLETFVHVNPTAADALRFLGDLYYRAGRLSEAESMYRAVLALNSSDRETHNRLGNVYASEHRLNDAIVEYERSLPDVDAAANLVPLLLHQGSLSAFMHNVQQDLDLHPFDPYFLTEMAQLEEANHDPSSAYELMQRAVTVDPNDFGVMNTMGLVLLDLHRTNDAVAQFTRCLQRNANDYECLTNIGAAYLTLKRDDDAQIVLEKARRLAPERHEAFVDLGYMEDDRGNWKAAVTDYVQALAIFPYAREAYVDLGLEYLQRQMYPLAESVLTKGVSIYPNDGALRVLLGQVYQSEGHRDLALAQFRVAVYSDDPEAASIARTDVTALQSGH